MSVDLISDMIEVGYEESKRHAWGQRKHYSVEGSEGILCFGFHTVSSNAFGGMELVVLAALAYEGQGTYLLEHDILEEGVDVAMATEFFVRQQSSRYFDEEVEIEAVIERYSTAAAASTNSTDLTPSVG